MVITEIEFHVKCLCHKRCLHLSTTATVKQHPGKL